ncbi:GntR family transcriptional regulator [Solicola gregarius]|uniref:GntR family transcriptional regulator n=1 Tax=Solicola gregarius TaxID=2908642 RepID=A0AA46TIG5_9ACTN|nr:GntR family transcriptional regulator [Solicola gregarius]UYM05934.1 GntR family transcriptional regulator [Solicola gregarius]
MSDHGDVDAVLSALADRPRTIMSTSAERAANVVREQVAEGRLRSGTRLPEERLAAALGVSRNTLREALSQLVSERILVREPNRGVLVARPDADDIADIYRVRMIIEPASVRRAEADDTRAAAIQAAVDEGRAGRADGNWNAVASANQHFHRGIVALARSPRLDTQMGLVLAEMRLVFHLMNDPHRFHEPYLDQNARIASLLMAREYEQAATDLEDYLRGARDELLSAVPKP